MTLSIRFTFEEIMKLDAGSAFNIKKPEQARQSFTGQDVLVFEDVFRIAEGKRIKRNPDGSRILYKMPPANMSLNMKSDPADNGHRPGVYIEVKIPENYPGIEEQIYDELTRMGGIRWRRKNKRKDPVLWKGKVNTGNTRGKILVQTFSRPGMLNFKRVFRERGPVQLPGIQYKTNEFSRTQLMDEIISLPLMLGAQFIGTNLGDTNDGLTLSSQRKYMMPD